MSWTVITGIAPRWESALATTIGASARAHLVRRCADVTELIGVARAGLARVAVVSSDLRGLDREVVNALQDSGVHIVGVQPPGDEDGTRALRRWGVRAVVATDVTVQDLDLALASLDEGGTTDPVEKPARDAAERQRPRRAARPDEARSAEPGAPEASPGPDDDDAVRGVPDLGGAAELADAPDAAGLGDPWDLDELDGLADPADDGEDPPQTEAGGSERGWEAEPDTIDPTTRGQVVVVWGAYGSPGRTTVAMNLAAELASPLEPVILLDADTYAASVAQCLAVLDEAPGIAAAARAADQGNLDAEALDRIAPEVHPGLSVLTGLPRADRWPELRDASLADVLEQCRHIARWVVVDVAPLVEQDEELSFDTHAPRRNGATLTSLEAADRVVVVGAADPVGLHRLIRCLDLLPGLSAGVRDVVVTRVRSGPVGPDPQRRIQESLSRFAGTDTVHLVPEDRESLDAALLHGQLLSEVRPGSALRRSIQEIAAVVRGQKLRARPRRRSWRSRSTRSR